MGCSHSNPSRSDTPPQGPRISHKETRATQSSIEIRAKGTVPQQSRATTTDHGLSQTIDKKEVCPPPETNASTSRRRTLPSALATGSSGFVTPGGHGESLTEERKRLLRSIREGPSIADHDRLSAQLLRDSLTGNQSPEDARAAFYKGVRRSVTLPLHSNTPFVYKPLPTPTSIRLLRLLPGREDGMIRCTLTTVDLNQTVVARYSCLSYTWGNPLSRGVGFTDYDDAEQTGEFSLQHRRPISCNGRLLYIGKNLHDAFEQLPVYPDNYVAGAGVRTPLHLLAEKGLAAPIFRQLLEGAPIDAMDNDGKSALHHAAANGHFDTVDILLKSGSNQHQLDFSRRTAADYAWKNGYPRIAELIANFTPDKRVPLPNIDQRRAANKEQDYLWVDAICINQEDLKEKTRQVNMMDRVYESANTTVIWLGREDHHTQTSIETILKLYPHLDKICQSDIATYQSMSSEAYRMRGLPDISQKEWDALASIYLRQWFQRVWVLQEIVLAQGVVCFCGPHRIPWHFIGVTRALDLVERQKHAGSFKYIPADGTPWHIERNFVLMLSCRERRMLDESTLEARAASNFYRWPGGQFQKPLARLVLDSWTLSATDPRDKVFALLALTRADPESQNMLADYTLSVERVYARVTKMMMAQSLGNYALGDSGSTVGPLYILGSVVDSDARMRTLPSWVPDFSIPAINPLEAPSFSAAGSKSSTVQWGISPISWNELSLRGSRIGTITGATTQRQVTGSATKYSFDSTWFELLRTVRKPYPTGQQLSEVLWRTLCADQDVTGNSPAPVGLGSQFRDFVCAQMLADAEIGSQNSLSGRDALFDLLGFWSTEGIAGTGETSLYDTTLGIEVDLGAGRISADRPYPPWFESLVESEPRSFIPSFPYLRNFANNPKYRIWDSRRRITVVPPSGQKDYFEAFGKAFGARRMFKMAGVDGGPDFLGIGHRSLQLGDEVWVMPGSKVPFVLRKMQHWTYKFVGEAYVHGMMHGEGFRDELTHVILV